MMEEVETNKVGQENGAWFYCFHSDHYTLHDAYLSLRSEGGRELSSGVGRHRPSHGK